MRLTDEDVDRIARRVVGKVVTYGLAIVAALWLAPIVIIALMNFVLYATPGMPDFVRVALAAAVIAGPVVLIVWARGRSRRST
jgi:hypothetical protein